MQLIVQENTHELLVRFYLKRKIGDCTVIVGQRDGSIVDQPISTLSNENEPIPLVEMPKIMAESFLKAVCDYRARPKIKSKDFGHLQGSLFTTELTPYEKNKDYFDPKNAEYRKDRYWCPVNLTNIREVVQQFAFDNDTSMSKIITKTTEWIWSDMGEAPLMTKEEIKKMILDKLKEEKAKKV